MEPRERIRIAALAFALHHPGLRLFFGLRQSPTTRRINAYALAITIFASGAGAALAPDGLGWFFALAIFTTGHFFWSTTYAYLVLTRFESTFQQAPHVADRSAPALAEASARPMGE